MGQRTALARRPRTVPLERGDPPASRSSARALSGGVPVDRRAEPGLERGPGHESEPIASPRRVECPTWLPIGLRRVPADLAREAGQPGDKGHQLADRDLRTYAQIDRFI